MYFSVSLGEAQAVLAKAEAKSKAIRLLSDALAEQVHFTALSYYLENDIPGMFQ